MFDVKTCFGQADNGKIASCDGGIEKLQQALPAYERFCMPGHKGELFKADLTELDGGNIFPATSVENAQLEAARFYKVRECRFLTGGASQGIKAAILAVGGDIVAPTFTHRSVEEGVRLSGKRYIRFDTGIDCDGLPNVPTAADYEKAIIENPCISAVVVTSPDYFGRVACVEEIAKLCRRRGKLLIADCAHGAHFASRVDVFPEGGEKFADFAVLSSHKTLRALTQSALGVINNPSYIERYDDALALLGTTSPSYLLLASIESAIEFEKSNASKYDALLKECSFIREKVSCLKNDDPLRLTVKFNDGEKAFARLVEKGFMPEAYYGKFCIFIVTLSDTPDKVWRLGTALEEIKGL